MHKYILFFLTALSTLLLKAEDPQGQLVGATGIPGTLAPDKPSENILLTKQIINFRGFRNQEIGTSSKIPLSSYQNLLEFKNTSGQSQSIECHIPINVFFTDFARGTRSQILDNLARIMPDLFDFSQTEKTIKAELERKFEKRNFIRRVVNLRDLDKLHMDVRIWVNDTEVLLNKVTMEFRFSRDKERDIEVLAMETKLHCTINFKSEHPTTIRTNLLAPAFKTGYESTYFYSPFMTGSGRAWAGSIDKTYVVYPALDNTLLIPYYMDTQWKSFGFDKYVAVLSGHEPEVNEKIGFYSTSEEGCGCYQGDGQKQQVQFPMALQDISGSSWYQDKPAIKGRCLGATPDRQILRWLPDFELGMYGKLALHDKSLETKNPSAAVLSAIATTDCGVDGEPVLTFTEGYHPAWAFDVSKDSFQVGNQSFLSDVGPNTGWCVYDAGGGKGQYMSFTITQPVDLLRLYTANYADEANYNRFNRVKRMELVQQDGPHREEFLLSDILTSTYVVDLQPGSYRLYILEIFPGLNDQVTCLGTLNFHFAAPDEWFSKYFKQL